MLDELLHFIGSLTFLGYIITFNIAFVCGCIFAGARRDDDLEGVGQGPAGKRNERAALPAGPGGGR